MSRKGRARLRPLVDVVAERYPEHDAHDAIAGSRVTVDRLVVTNPSSLVRENATVAVRPVAVVLRGERKLRAALTLFAVPVAGRVALDLGAAAGGFTRVLLAAGAARVFAVDVGYGQLLGSLRGDPRVVALERTNLAALDDRRVPEAIDLVTADLSYVSLATAIPQLNGRIRFAAGADLVAVVKPQFELGLAVAPHATADLRGAGERARVGVESAGWSVAAVRTSPVRGARGSVELLLHARRP